MRVELDRDTAAWLDFVEPAQAVCGFTPDDYANVLADLLPWGWAWPRDPMSVLMRVLAGLAVEFSRIHGRDCDLLAEAYPGTALEALSDWERITGLPDDCLPATSSLQARRNAVMLKLAMRGGASKEYFIQLAKTLGFDITIEEFSPFLAGHSCAGDPANGPDWTYTWLIRAPEETITYFRAGQSVAGDPLAEWGNAVLECVFNRIKPAHAILQFAYGDNPPVRPPTDPGVWGHSRWGQALWS